MTLVPRCYLVNQGQLLLVAVVGAGGRPCGEVEEVLLEVVEDEALLEEVVASGQGQVAFPELIVRPLKVACFERIRIRDRFHNTSQH